MCIITARKVMFLHLSISHSVHRGVCIPACTGQLGVCFGDVCPGGVCVEGMSAQGVSAKGVCLPGGQRQTPPPAPELTTEAGGTHPTGLNSWKLSGYSSTF